MKGDDFVGKEEQHQAKVEDLIAIVYNLEHFPELCKGIEELSKKYSRQEIIHHLKSATLGSKPRLGKRKIYKFYQESKELIDNINKHSDIFFFLANVYQQNGRPKDDIACYYKYLINHQDSKEQILQLLKRIKKLNIDQIIWNPSADFASKEYSIEEWYLHSEVFRIAYLENMKIIPNGDKYIIKYTTAGSNYEIKFASPKSNIAKNEITVTSLNFPVESIPENLTWNSAYNEINALSNEQEETLATLRNIIQLNVATDELEKIAQNTKATFSRILGASNKQELKNTLFQISDGIAKLYGIKKDYTETSLEGNSSLSLEIINNETKQFIKRREEASIDLD